MSELLQGLVFDRPVGEIIKKAMDKGLVLINMAPVRPMPHWISSNIIRISRSSHSFRTLRIKSSVADLFEKQNILANVQEVGVYLETCLDSLVEEFD